MTHPYPTTSDFLNLYFPGIKMQKLSVDTASSCPNRDGTIGRGGCSYCSNASFTPPCADRTKGISTQLEAGKKFFERKYPKMRYLAYFQSYTSTHGKAVGLLHRQLTEALEVEGVDGIIIGTRPDCLPQHFVEVLGQFALQHFVMLEFGAETSHDSTLQLVNRCHTWQQTVDAVTRAHDAGIPVGLHLIMGLPNEDVSMMLKTIERVNTLPVDMVKLHHMQIIKGTPLYKQWTAGAVHLHEFTVDSYAEFCVRVIKTLRPDIAIDRFLAQAPSQMVAHPQWGIKNYQFTQMVNKLATSVTD